MDGRSGAVYQGHAAFTDGGLAFTDGSQAVTWPYGEIRLLDGSVGSDWLSLALADDSPARLRLSGSALAELRRRCTALRAPTTADRRGRRLVLWWS
ncbi:hypothetical protein, partial [Ferrovibrio sp.]|uniref:hypothetical protein n=1 Tax=Ferrovibrio sp. TaxID=1917215 RepID=UPI00311EB528